MKCLPITSTPHDTRLRGFRSFVVFRLIYGDIRESTSGLEPPTYSLRVSQWVLQGFAGSCKSRIFKGLCFLRLAACLHRIALPVVSEWCQYRPCGRSPCLLALAMVPRTFAGHSSPTCRL